MKPLFNIDSIRLLPLIIFSLFPFRDIAAQQFYRTGQISIDPAQVIIENYFQVSLPIAKTERSGRDQFDRRNPYTGIFMISDDKKKNYHILYQTDFLGRLSYLALSVNLLSVFNRKEKPMAPFNKCLMYDNEYFTSIQVTETMVKCILERLAFCAR
jgi:hypothetical protein